MNVMPAYAKAKCETIDGTYTCTGMTCTSSESSRICSPTHKGCVEHQEQTGGTKCDKTKERIP